MKRIAEMNGWPILGIAIMVVGMFVFLRAFDHLPQNRGLWQLVAGAWVLCIGVWLMLNF